MIGPANLRMEGDDRVLVAHLSGEVDLSNAREVGAVLTESVGNSALGVVLDLSETRYIDSSGIQLVFELAERLGGRQQRLSLAVPEDAPIRRVLGLVEVEQVVPIASSVEAARLRVEEGA